MSERRRWRAAQRHQFARMVMAMSLRQAAQAVLQQMDPDANQGVDAAEDSRRIDAALRHAARFPQLAPAAAAFGSGDDQQINAALRTFKRYAR